MIQDRLNKIEERLKQSETIKESDKAEMLNLLKTLRTEIADLSQTDHEHAESIARFAELSTHEATRDKRSDALFDLSIEGLITSGRGFEISHPKLVAVINAFCNYLTDMGI
jgi:DNA repair exonuclease SbcCD ATPase subunit